MELRILNSIIYGGLKPWLPENRDDKFYSPYLTKEFTNPESPQTFYSQLQNILSEKKGLFEEESISVYLAQTDGHYRPNITEPLVEVATNPPRSKTCKFYHFLIQNEVTRITSTLCKAICKQIEDIDRKQIINTTIQNAKTLLQNIKTAEDTEETDQTTEYVLNELKSGTIRLIKEVELLFPQSLKYPESDQYELYGELLQESEIPESEWYKPTSEYNRVSNRLSDYFGQPTRTPKALSEGLSFRFKGDEEKLRTVITTLTLRYDLIDENENTADDLINILLSKDLHPEMKSVRMGCATNRFVYVLHNLMQYFENLSWQNIERSKLFYSKKGQKPISASALSSSLPKKYFNHQQEIDNILKKMQ